MITGVLLSGGMDSAIALHWAKARRASVIAFAVDYKQRHARELDAAKRIADAAGVPFRKLTLHLSWPPMSGDVLPGRNLALLNLAAAQLAIRGGGAPAEVVVGANAEDLDGFPDCRPGFLAAASKAIGLGLGMEDRVFIAAPFIASRKADMLREARSMPGAWDAIALSWSCYQGGAQPCGECGACVKRVAAFAEIGEEDPWRG